MAEDSSPRVQMEPGGPGSDGTTCKGHTSKPVAKGCPPREPTSELAEPDDSANGGSTKEPEGSSCHPQSTTELSSPKPSDARTLSNDSPPLSETLLSSANTSSPSVDSDSDKSKLSSVDSSRSVASDDSPSVAPDDSPSPHAREKPLHRPAKPLFGWRH